MIDEIIQLMRLADLPKLRAELIKRERDAEFMAKLKAVFEKAKRESK